MNVHRSFSAEGRHLSTRGNSRIQYFKQALGGALSMPRAILLLAIALPFLACPWANAQVLYGSLTGEVTDPTGAAIPGAKVQATEMHKGIRQQATSDQAGLYRFSDLLPGLWEISVSAPGFNTAETQNIVINPNVTVQQDEKLSVAQAQVSVTVTSAPPELQTQEADVHTNISTAMLQQMPSVSSEGKNFQDLLRIVPGSTIPLESNSAAGNPARAMTSNVNGQSTQGNDTRIDGILDAYPWLPNNVAYVPPEDGIETVNITTNSYDAEQGMANGAEVNVVTKSGTNRFHGDAYEFHTDDQLKAENFFSPPPSQYKRALNIFNQFGGSVGGPIKRDKLFFFGDYQGTRQVLAPSNASPQTVPFGSLLLSNAKSAGYFDFRPFQTAAYGLVDKSGNPVHIYDPNTGNADGSGRQIISCNGIQDAVCLNRVDPATLTMLSLIPAPTPSLATLDSNNYLDTQKGTFKTDDYDAKVNYVPGQNSTVFGKFSTSRGDIFDPPALGPAEGNATNGGQLGNAFTRIYVIGLGGTHTFTPNLLLDGNVGFTRQHLTAEAPDIAADQQYGLDTLKIPGTNNSSDPTNQLYWGIPAFQINGFSNLGNPNTGNPFVFRDNQYVANGNLSWVRKNHQLRFGAEWDHVQMNHFQPEGGTFQTARGSFGMDGIATEQVNCTGGPPISAESCSNPDAPTNTQWNSFADFLLGLPYETGKAIQDTDPIALRWSQWAVYARDLWQVTPKFSADLGFRWEYYPMAYSDHGKGARVLDPTTMQVLIGGYGSIPKNDGVQVGPGEFLPRIGLDYRVHPTTVLRAGFGISADSNNWRYLRNDYPADTISSYSGTNTGGVANYTQFAPAASFTGTNAVGPYANLPIGIVPIALPNISSGSIPLPNNLTTSTIGNYPKFRRGYIYSYNATVEQQYAGGFVSDISYVGAREVRPIINLNLNAAPAGGGATGELLNAEFGGNWGGINTLIPAGSSSYNSLQTKLTRRFAQSSVIGVLFTWSKTEDFEDNEELSAPLWNYPAYWQRNKALAGFDHNYNFEGYWLYSLPFGKGQSMANHGIAAALAGGWTLTGVLSRLSGAPFTVTDNNGAGNLNAPGNQQTPNIIAPIHVTKGTPYESPSGCSNSTSSPNLSCLYFDPRSFATVTTPATFGNAGRNIIRGPGYFDLDANLYRNFKITEFLTFQFEADAFGVTNTPHFGNPDSNLTDSTFGKITSEAQGANASLGGSGGERLWYFGGKFIF